ncbi:MAG: hypothetical protein HY443_00025 [Candidatus Nealsonbacteria bacterium]|nr:hypothetical protein [Candidatus Nealsonbacteria bacterium]
MGKSVYVCGPLTELSAEEQARAKAFYVQLADVCQETTGVRAFVPHEHYDPVLHANFTPSQVDEAERRQVCEGSSLLLVVALAPSWGGGIEVEMANRSGVPVIVLCEQEKLDQRRISRLLRGNPAVRKIISYRDPAEALEKLRSELA